jgi:c-di-GMP-binding flagellar brake protein YcgR
MNQNSPSNEEDKKLSFEDMRIRVGDRIQLQLPSSYGEERVFVKVIGFLDHFSLLVTTPEFNANRQTLREKEKILVRGFSKQVAFAFDSVIKKVNIFPFSYMHLSFPEKIQGSLVRKDLRIKIRLIASVKKVEDTNKDEKFSVVISNLSASGAYVHSKNSIFSKDQKIQITFQIKVHQIDNVMVMNAIIRNVQDEKNESNELIGVGLGLQFVDIEPHSSMLLQSLAYQQMIEHPDTVV